MTIRTPRTALLPLVFIAAAMPSVAPAQLAGRPPATPAQIVAGVRACLAATSQATVSESALAQAGWQKGKLSDGKGKAVASPLGFFGRKDLNVMLLTSVQKDTGICTVLGRIESVDPASPVVQALSADLKSQPRRYKGADLFWFAGDKLIGLAAAGQRNAPSVRVTIMQIAEKK